MLVLTNLATCCHKLYSMCLLLRTSQNILLSFNSVLRVLSMDVLGLSIVYTLSDDFSNSKAISFAISVHHEKVKDLDRYAFCIIQI